MDKKDINKKDIKKEEKKTTGPATPPAPNFPIPLEKTYNYPIKEDNKEDNKDK